MSFGGKNLVGFCSLHAPRRCLWGCFTQELVMGFYQVPISWIKDFVLVPDHCDGMGFGGERQSLCPNTTNIRYQCRRRRVRSGCTDPGAFQGLSFPLELRGFQAPPFPVHPGYAAAQAINYKRKPPHLLKPSLREEKNTAFSLSLKNFIAVKPAPGSLVKQKRASDGLGDSWGGSGGDTGCPESSSTNPPPCCTDGGGGNRNQCCPLTQP